MTSKASSGSANYSTPPVCITEGRAKLAVPKASFKDPHHCMVFFNPRMRFSRSMGSLCVGALNPSSVLDGLCATGARGIRYAAENPSAVKQLALVDANPLATPFCRKNIALNKLGGKARAECLDFNDYCESHVGEFDFVEIDPFGSPAPFVRSSLATLRKGGVLSFTSTDLANVVKKNKPTLRDYGAKPLYNEFSHETALRILLGFVAREADATGLAVEPLSCYYEGHHVKITVRVLKGKDARLAKKIGFISYCDACHARYVGKNAKCQACGVRLLHAGPLWLGDYCSASVLKKMSVLNEARGFEDKNKIASTLELLSREQGFQPWFYDVHATADHFGLSVKKKMDYLVGALRKKGFKAVRTHFEPTAIKTNAGIDVVRKAIAESAGV